MPANVYIQDSYLMQFDRKETLFIDGKWHEGAGEEPVKPVDPSTEEVLATFSSATRAQVFDAAGAAKRAFSDWKDLSSQKRASYLNGFARGLEARRDRLVDIQMRNNGKPRHEAQFDLDDAIATFDYYAGLTAEIDAAQDELVAHSGGEHHGFRRKEPLGPVGMIVPWNFPLVTSAWKIAPALGAGCTAVMKTSEVTPIAELVYGEIAEEIGLPSGVLNIVTGASDTGIAVTGASAFRKISFTGSNMVGAKVMEAVATRCLPIALELGGKSPIIVTEDVDIAHAVDCIIGGIFFNAGQMCSATSRLLVQRSVEKDVLDLLVEKASRLVTASPFAEDCAMGPITTRQQFAKVKGFLQQAAKDGLDCLTGGLVPDGPGFFVPPAIYRNVPRDHPLWNEEIFGPVLAAASFETDEEALAMANDTEFGLVGTVVCGDPERAKHLADRIEAGHVWINTPQIVYPDSAWGGFKQSGIGRELGPWGLAAYQGIKHITLPS